MEYTAMVAVVVMEYTAMAMVVVEERTVATEVWERMMRSATFSVVFSMVLCAMPRVTRRVVGVMYGMVMPRVMSLVASELFPRDATP